jgi:hypothetical protein
MPFWIEVLVGLVANVLGGTVLVAFYVIIQWFLHATDVTISYGWRFEGPNFHPSFDIRNRSISKTYFLANVVYTKGKIIVDIDNKSLWGKELKPGTIEFLEVTPVKGITSLSDCLEVEISVRLQSGRRFWLKGQGPGQSYVGRIQRVAFWLRKKLETAAVSAE